jgi:hypothetical protein
MIIKGSSRAGPKQLATHLQRADTNERVVVLELQSGSPDLASTFRDWQTLAEGTRGSKGLYHVNIDPDARYTMTPAQWARAVEVLEKELGLEGQPRAVVLHEKHGREHIHVVWARTDLDTMTMRSDSMNFAAHERASQALELEFGHEAVPGKHAKRDRDKQPEFPKAEVHHDEWQQAERAGVSIEERRAQLAALQRASDNGLAFKAALEEAGYILAKGDRRDFVIVDEIGGTHSLGRELKLKAAEVRAFMADVDRDQLPTPAEAATLQRSQERGKEISPDAPAPEAVPVTPAPTEKPALDAALAKALDERHAAELAKWHDRHGKELAELETKLALDVRDKLANIDAMHSAARERLARQHQAETSDLWGRVQALINPEVAARRASDRAAQAEALRDRQMTERTATLTPALAANAAELDALKDRQARKIAEVEAALAAERERYANDQVQARRILAELQEQQRKLQQEHDRSVAMERGQGPPGPAK